MKFGVVIFPGSNCDKDMIHVLRDVINQEVRELWHKDTDIRDFKQEDCIVLPGGFSYGDYLRTGAIARFSPIMEHVIEFANKGGNVLGICNGFQILCEASLLPGALLLNENQQFICRNSYLKCMTNRSMLTSQIDTARPLNIPIAHADGRYFADPETIEGLHRNDQILFKYSDAAGNVTQAHNPNGSVDNIAGICNLNRNVFGMMPHPERAAEEALGNTDGLVLFESMVTMATAE